MVCRSSVLAMPLQLYEILSVTGTRRQIYSITGKFACFAGISWSSVNKWSRESAKRMIATRNNFLRFIRVKNSMEMLRIQTVFQKNVHHGIQGRVTHRVTYQTLALCTKTGECQRREINPFDFTVTANALKKSFYLSATRLMWILQLQKTFT